MVAAVFVILLIKCCGNDACILKVRNIHVLVLHMFSNHVALQCERTFVSPPRGASDRPLVVFLITVGAILTLTRR